jgi:pseudouridine-5'-phosphate glycosidase
MINKIIDDALIEAKEKGISGKETTPFLLAKVKELTKGKSLEANLALVYNNAKVAAQIAKELEKVANNE